MGGKVWTEEDIMAIRAESEEYRKESDKYRAESDKYRAESDKYRAEADKYTAAAAQTRAETEELMKEFKRGMVELRQQVSGISDSNGLVAENVVYNALEKRMALGGVTFDDIQPSVRKTRKLPNGERLEVEYDVVLHNGSAVAIVEAKYRVRSEDVERLVDVQLPRFRQMFQEYKDFTIYLGIGGMSFEKGVEMEALEKGIATLKLDGDSVVEINDQNIKAWS